MRQRLGDSLDPGAGTPIRQNRQPIPIASRIDGGGSKWLVLNELSIILPAAYDLK